MSACEIDLERAIARLHAHDATLSAVMVECADARTARDAFVFWRALRDTRAPVAMVAFHGCPLDVHTPLLDALLETRAPLVDLRLCGIEGNVHLAYALRIVLRHRTLRVRALRMSGAGFGGADGTGAALSRQEAALRAFVCGAGARGVSKAAAAAPRAVDWRAVVFARAAPPAPQAHFAGAGVCVCASASVSACTAHFAAQYGRLAAFAPRAK